MLTCWMVDDAERKDMEDRSIAAGTFRYGLYKPGMMWFCRWFHDPDDPRDMEDGVQKRERVLAASPTGGLLSIHYWDTAWRERPPIMVMCPNRRMWLLDQPSRNSTGWVVTGTAPKVTAAPSIVVPGYHGWLKNGVFTDDLEGRGPHGVA